MLRVLIFLFLLFPLSAQTSSDQGIELIHADRHIGKKVNGEQLRIFEGNVHFRQDTIQMWCEKAVMYEKSDKIDFLGNVIITDNLRTIRAAKIEYFWESRQAYCYDRVRIKSKDDSLFARFLEYNFKSGEVLARGDVYLFNRENLTSIWGKEGIYKPKEKFSQVAGNAHLMKLDTSSLDTMHIYADILQYFNRDSEKVAIALGSVRIAQGNLKAVADTAFYYVDKQIAVLNYNPQAWYEDSEMKSLQMVVHFDSLRLREITLKGKAVAKTVADSTTDEYDILKGKLIRFYIKDKKPERIIAIDNASSLYYVTEESAEKGANYATADTIKIFFTAGKLDSISIIGGARGTYYPEKFKKEIAIERP
ncbi:MAG: hypothetical protein GXO77_09530 [Calditrichaeota bacterium]|nr:hypothetical protein [Calditrichota bacterium]